MTASEITIDYLADRPEFSEQLANWSWNEWHWIYRQRGQTLEHAVKNYRERANIDRLPLALVALVEEELVGTASLKPNDLEIRPEMTPCLGGMFVVSKCRRRGIASLLVRRALDVARGLNLRELFLWTDSPEAEALYVKLGWRAIERLEYAGKPIVAMHIDL